MPKLTTKSVTETLTIILFVGLLAVPFLGTFIGFDLYPQEGENRKLTEFPNLGKMALDELPNQLSDYANDHVGLRNTFIHGHNKFYDEVFKIELGKATEGLDRWLFLDDNTKDVMGFRQFSDEELRCIVQSITQRYQWISEHGIPFITVIPPDKINVYSEMLPGFQPAPGAIRRWQQVEAALPPLPELNITYLSDTLVQQKSEHPLYFKNDTHWNSYGAYYAYRKMLDLMTPYFPDLNPVSLDGCSLIEEQTDGDLPSLMGKTGEYPELNQTIIFPGKEQISATDYPVGSPKKWHTWSPITIPQLFKNPNGKGRLLVFSDSFGQAPIQFLAHHFEEVAWFWMYAGETNLEALIEDFKPDLILEIHLERMIENFKDTSYYLEQP